MFDSNTERRPGRVEWLFVPQAKLWLAAFCLLLVPVAGATSVAIMVTSRTILIAADGIDTRTVNGVDTFVPYCKIRNEGSVFFTAAGDLSIPELNFNVWRLAADAVRKSKTISGISDRIERSVLARLPSIVESSKVADPGNYAKWLSGTPVILIASATFENGVPRVVAVSFPLDSRGAILKPIRNTLGGPGVVVDTGFFGYNERMKAAASRRTAASWQPRFRKHPVSFIQGLIQLEIDQAKRDHRRDVGHPIAILRITKTGGAFVAGHKGACP
jgi:hypothetical protein